MHTALRTSHRAVSDSDAAGRLTSQGTRNMSPFDARHAARRLRMDQSDVRTHKMGTAWRNPSPAFGLGKVQVAVGSYLQPQGVHSRNGFRRWLEAVLRDFSEQRPASPSSSGPMLSNFCLRVWEFAVDCATRYCPECRKEL